jgi:hypothetical protein
MERGLGRLAPFSFSRAAESFSIEPASIPKGNVCLQLFRLVAAEDFMGKGLTGGGSRRYLWASFVVCIEMSPVAGKREAGN